MSAIIEEYIPGDFVAVNTDRFGRREGTVIGSYVDFAGRQIVQVQIEPTEVYNAWQPTVTRVKRTISYQRPSTPQHVTVERKVYW